MDFVDANVFWWWLGGGKCKQYLSCQADAGTEFATSFFVLAELYMAMTASGKSRAEAEEWVLRISSLPNLVLVDVDWNCFSRAMSVAVECGLDFFDSLHAAVCLEKGVRLATFDKHFQKVPGLKTFAPALD